MSWFKRHVETKDRAQQSGSRPAGDGRVMVASGDDVVAGLVHQQAVCRRCGRSIEFEEGATRASRRGFGNRVMCRTCHTLYEAKWPSGHFELGAMTDESGKRLVTARTILSAGNRALFGCGLSPDGTWIAASGGGALVLWAVASGTQRSTVQLREPGLLEAVGPDGTWAAVKTGLSTIKVIDLADGAERASFTSPKGMLYACAVAPDGAWIVTGHGDKTLRIWDVASGTERAILNGHKHMVDGCAVSPDGTWIVSSSADNTLKTWDVASGSTRATFDRPGGLLVKAGSISPDGAWIVARPRSQFEDPGLDPRSVKILDAATGAVRTTLGHHQRLVTGWAVSPDGTSVITSSDDHTLKLWGMTSHEDQITFVGHNKSVTGCAISPDGRWIVSVSKDQTLRIWDVE